MRKKINNKIEKLELIPHKDFKKQLMKSKGFRKVYEEMKPEMELLKSLIRKRIENKFTQRQLASKIGIAQSALARFESGQSEPSLGLYRKVASGLGFELKLMLK